MQPTNSENGRARIKSLMGGGEPDDYKNRRAKIKSLMVGGVSPLADNTPQLSNGSEAAALAAMQQQRINEKVQQRFNPIDGFGGGGREASAERALLAEQQDEQEALEHQRALSKWDYPAQVATGVGFAAPLAAGYNTPAGVVAAVGELGTSLVSGGIDAYKAEDGEGWSSFFKGMEESPTFDKAVWNTLPFTLTQSQKDKFKAYHAKNPDEKRATKQKAAAGWIAQLMALPKYANLPKAEQDEIRAKAEREHKAAKSVIELNDSIMPAVRNVANAFGATMLAGSPVKAITNPGKLAKVYKYGKEVVAPVVGFGIGEALEKKSDTAQSAISTAALGTGIAKIGGAIPPIANGVIQGAKVANEKFANATANILDDIPSFFKKNLGQEPGGTTAKIPDKTATLAGQYPDILPTMAVNANDAQRKSLIGHAGKTEGELTKAANARVARDTKSSTLKDKLFGKAGDKTKSPIGNTISKLRDTLKKAKDNAKTAARVDSGFSDLELKELSRVAKIDKETGERATLSVSEEELSKLLTDALEEKGYSAGDKVRGVMKGMTTLPPTKANKEALPDKIIQRRDDLYKKWEDKQRALFSKSKDNEIISTELRKGEDGKWDIPATKSANKLKEFGQQAIRETELRGDFSLSALLDFRTNLYGKNWDDILGNARGGVVAALDKKILGMLEKNGGHADVLRDFRRRWKGVRDVYDADMGDILDGKVSDSKILQKFFPSHSSTPMDPQTANQYYERFRNLSAALGKNGKGQSGPLRAAIWMDKLIKDDNARINYFEKLLTANMGSPSDGLDEAIGYLGDRALRSFFNLSEKAGDVKSAAHGSALNNFKKLRPNQVTLMRDRAIARRLKTPGKNGKKRDVDVVTKDVNNLMQNAFTAAHFRGAMGIAAKAAKNDKDSATVSRAYAKAYRKMIGADGSEDEKVFNAIFPDTTKTATPQREVYKAMANAFEGIAELKDKTAYSDIIKESSKVWSINELGTNIYRIFVRPKTVAVSPAFGVQEVITGILRKAGGQRRITKILQKLGADYKDGDEKAVKLMDFIIAPDVDKKDFFKKNFTTWYRAMRESPGGDVDQDEGKDNRQ